MKRFTRLELYGVWFGDTGTDKKQGGGAGGGWVEDATIFIGSEQDGQD